MNSNANMSRHEGPFDYFDSRGVQRLRSMTYTGVALGLVIVRGVSQCGVSRDRLATVGVGGCSAQFAQRGAPLVSAPIVAITERASRRHSPGFRSDQIGFSLPSPPTPLRVVWVLCTRVCASRETDQIDLGVRPMELALTRHNDVTDPN